MFPSCGPHVWSRPWSRYSSLLTRPVVSTKRCSGGLHHFFPDRVEAGQKQGNQPANQSFTGICSDQLLLLSGTLYWDDWMEKGTFRQERTFILRFRFTINLLIILNRPMNSSDSYLPGDFHVALHGAPPSKTSGNNVWSYSNTNIVSLGTSLKADVHHRFEPIGFLCCGTPFIRSGQDHSQTHEMYLTSSAGLVLRRWRAGLTLAHRIDGNDPELVVDKGSELQNDRVQVSWVRGQVPPSAWLPAVLLKLDQKFCGQRQVQCSSCSGFWMCLYFTHTAINVVPNSNLGLYC